MKEIIRFYRFVVLFFSMSVVPVVILLDFLASILHLKNPILRVVLITAPMSLINLTFSFWFAKSCNSISLLVGGLLLFQILVLYTTRLYLEVVTKYIDGNILV